MPEMIDIDGSIGHGQVVRTAVSLSALTLKPIRVFNIRKSRPNSGLAAQHLTGVKIAAEFCDAEVEGAELGSGQFNFIPKEMDVPSKKVIDIGTAGSIGLLLQTLTPICIFSGQKVDLSITGGTAGLGAPPIEYLQYVTFVNLEKMGLSHPSIEILKQGFYPKGGGIVRIIFNPVEVFNPIELKERGDLLSIFGISVVGKLPEHIADRQAGSAKDYFSGKDISCNRKCVVERNITDTLSPGTSITLWAMCENSVIGADNIGKRGVPAEKVGKKAARELYSSLETGAAFDKYMADQIIPFMALADGRSEVSVEKITDHCRTNMNIVEKLLDVQFDVKGNILSVEGVGFESKF